MITHGSCTVCLNTTCAKVMYFATYRSDGIQTLLTCYVIHKY